jgi:hypothetical protein
MKDLAGKGRSSPKIDTSERACCSAKLFDDKEGAGDRRKLHQPSRRAETGRGRIRSGQWVNKPAYGSTGTSASSRGFMIQGGDQRAAKAPSRSQLRNQGRAVGEREARSRRPLLCIAEPRPEHQWRAVLHHRRRRRLCLDSSYTIFRRKVRAKSGRPRHRERPRPACRTKPQTPVTETQVRHHLPLTKSSSKRAVLG